MKQRQIARKNAGTSAVANLFARRASHRSRRAKGRFLGSQEGIGNHGFLRLSGAGIQSKLTISQPNDQFEQEADRVADQVMRMSGDMRDLGTGVFAPSNHNLQRKCTCGGTAGPMGEWEECRKKRLSIQRRTVNSQEQSEVPPIVQDVLRSPGQPLDAATRAFMESRFGRDFAHVRVHQGAAAEQSARAIGAHAYTVGHQVVFGAGQYAPTRPQSQRLIAHELTHVAQQQGHDATAIQRDCSNPNFCQPYPTPQEADSAEWWIRHTYLPLEGVPTYGTEAGGLYESFLDRRPGDSLAPVLFSSDSSYLVSSFKNSGDTTDDIDDVIDLVGSRLDRVPNPPLSEGVPTMMSLANFLSPSETDNRPINYSNPFSVAGHIAGGIGSSAAGADYRKITYANVTLGKTILFGSTGYVSVELTPQYEVFDAVDFCPGDCGSRAEQIVTVPMSRLEASGAAYDVPFQVNFTAEPRSKRFWF